MGSPLLLHSVKKITIVLKAILKHGIQMVLLEWEDTKKTVAYAPTIHLNTV